MRKLLLFSALTLLAAPAAAAPADKSATCDAKPFTLKKPAAAEVAPKPPPPKAPPPKPAPPLKPARTATGIAPCKTPK